MNYNSYNLAITIGKVTITAGRSTLLITPFYIAIIASAAIAGTAAYMLNPSKNN